MCVLLQTFKLLLYCMLYRPLPSLTHPSFYTAPSRLVG